MPHALVVDRLITARLLAVATRHAGWRVPWGPDRAAALLELRQVATEQVKRRRPHPPAERIRPDLLAEVAGLLIGTAPDSHPKQNAIAADP
ncbi:hypothetical protein [Actinomadura opuntiae]|uniref:hypothetical protein n=1 Tax=Actinomadura sp. OS1-43 TaxID=604315 RepID=UPI00255B2757|nr:hypothetical protein [Actinomadura sp. OS1-43]MDL4812834.1 hypothetical protein [Actinomadura sp. OS1-43]